MNFLQATFTTLAVSRSSPLTRALRAIRLSPDGQSVAQALFGTP
ncbi:MAG TPA: hypothetical protein VGH74_07280 [Planctomycetaceae bacterium]